MFVLMVILRECEQIGLWNRNFKGQVIQCSLYQARMADLPVTNHKILQDS